MNFAAKHLFLFSITAFVLLCAVDMTDVLCFSHRNFYWQRTTGYLENVELCSMKDCSFEFIATCVSPCWDLFSGRILYPSASPQPWAQWHFKPLSLHNEQWDAGRSHVGRGGHPHCSHDHALKLCAMTVSVFKWLEATREQRLGALQLKINWMKVLDLVWHVTCKALLTVPNAMK